MRNWGHPPTLEGPCDPWVPHPLFLCLNCPSPLPQAQGRFQWLLSLVGLLPGLSPAHANNCS